MSEQRGQWTCHPTPWRRLAVVGAALAGALSSVGLWDLSASAATCGAATDARPLSNDPAALTAAFDGAPDGLQGADYQRAIDLPDGRRLWTFQDPFVARPGRWTPWSTTSRSSEHAGCFDLVHGGPTDRPAPWLAAAETMRHQRWFWPMGAALPGDGTVRIFLAEFVEFGSHYLDEAAPVATWWRRWTATTLEQRSLEPARTPAATCTAGPSSEEAATHISTGTATASSAVARSDTTSAPGRSPWLARLTS